jgi:hypothetical protein
LTVDADDAGDLGWLVTPFALWLSHDAGATWSKITTGDL